MSVSWNSFLSFRRKKKEKERYFHDKETQELFDTLLTTAEGRIKSLPKGQRYLRAQLGCDREPARDLDGQIVDYNVVPYSSKRMRPKPEKASDGRINSKGIPCLYLATDEKTAISEMRPWVGSYVTIAQFKTLKDLKVIDCSRGEIDPMAMTAAHLDKLWKLKQTTPEEDIKTIWRWIDLAFSEPVDRNDKGERNDKIVNYEITQIIAELFKTNGFDGVKYKSLLNNGENVALLDINAAKQIGDGKVFQVTRINVDFEQKWPFVFKKRKNNVGPEKDTG